LKTTLLVVAIALCTIASGLVVYLFSIDNSLGNSLGNQYPIMKQSDAPIPYDLVTITVHDKSGHLKYQETTHNIVTAAGAIWFCIEQNGCLKQINGTTPAVPNVAAPTWWVQFISGIANGGEPTGADCTTGVNGVISGVVSGGRCITNFGSLPNQYATGSIITVSLTGGTGQLRASTGTIDTTNNFVQTTPSTGCTITNTPLQSSTCQFTETSPVFTNLSGSTLTINALALASGTNTASAGPLIIAESVLTTPIVLFPSDTVSVIWTITT
jgi:hypothetical protein